MKVFKHIAMVFSVLLLVSSCAIDEIWQGVDTQDEEKVLTFKPRFYDFEAATKAIGDGSKVDKLLVHVYEGTDFKAYEFDIESKEVKEEVRIPFFHGKDYKVYFWAYSSDNDAYEIGESGLKGGVTVNYPDDTQTLTYESLEYLDAFYSVKEINLSDPGKDVTEVKLTRPFAQVNLAADAQQLKDAGATAVSFNIVVATEYIPGGEVLESKEYTFTFSCENNFQQNDKIDEKGNLYLGTMYIPVSGEAVTAEVTLTDKLGNKLKYSSSVEIPLVSNNRTNLIFEGIKPAWNNENCDEASDVPSTVGDDGWIHITTPEELAALLIFGAEGAQYHICNDLDLTGMSAETKVRLDGTAVFENVIIDAMNTAGDGSYSVKNLKGVKAFLGTASGVTVQNLVIDGASVSSDTHVGVLVNTLSGVSSFKNVTIQNSSAVTVSGAAGGMVGYIVRTDERNRSETLSVTIDGCKVNSVTASGSLAEGKFVGLLSGYDNGEQLSIYDNSEASTTLLNYNSSLYKAAFQSCFLDEKPDSKFDSYLGTMVYHRAIVNYGSIRIVPKWDGITTVEPIYRDSNKTTAEISSPFDLAYFQDKSLTGILFNSHVDMGSEVFTPIKTLSNLTGNSYILYNLKVNTTQFESSSSLGGGFIRQISNGNISDITFDGADITVAYDQSGTSGNAYAGTLAATVSGDTTIKNVDCKNGKLHAVCKMGGLVGRVSSGKFICSGCDISDYQISNEPSPDRFLETFKKEVDVPIIKPDEMNLMIVKYRNINANLHAVAEASFNSAGEVGGLIGFIVTAADIDDCTVTNTTLNATGQPDNKDGVKVTGPVSYEKRSLLSTKWSQQNKNANMTLAFTIAGRHVNKFIGDIRTCYTTDVVTVDNCYADDTNIYLQESNQQSYSTGTCPIVGCAYYVGGNIRIAGADSNKEFGESKGSVKVDGVEILGTQYADIDLGDLLQLL